MKMASAKNNLRLGRITLKNYRSYKGEHTISFSNDVEKPITVVQGGMGRGKTTLLNAIHWCFYGNSEISDNSVDENIVNSDVIDKMRVNDGDETFVEIRLYDNDGARYKINRSVTIFKEYESAETAYDPTVGGRLPLGMNTEEKISHSELPERSGPGDWRVTDSLPLGNSKIENVFPKSLSSYFLFDAELLDSFFDRSDRDNVRDGIEKLSGLPILEEAIKHLKKTPKESLAKTSNAELEGVKNEMFHLEKAAEKNQESIDRWEKELEGLRNEKKSIDKFLGNYSEKSIQLLQEAVEKQRDIMNEIRKNLKINQQKMNDWLLEANIIIRLRSSIVSSMEQCNAWEKEGKIPIAVSGHALKNILNSSPPVCICGTLLEEGSDGRRHIEGHLKKNIAESPIIHELITGRGRWEDMKDRVETYEKTLNEYKSERQRLETGYDKEKSELEIHVAELSESKIDEIRAKSRESASLEVRVNDLSGNIAAEKRDLETNNRNLTHKNLELERALKKSGMHEDYLHRRKLAESVIKLFKRCHEELAEDLRTNMALKTTEYFKRLVSKKEDFDQVEIQPNYKMSVLGPDKKTKQLSAGQSCCLALSYIAAIREVAEKNYFMIIDSPLHNISQRERVDIAQNLPKFIPGTQITLLMQDQEYKGETPVPGEKSIPSVRSTLIGNNTLWKEYLLESEKLPGDKATSVVIKEGES